MWLECSPTPRRIRTPGSSRAGSPGRPRRSSRIDGRERHRLGRGAEGKVSMNNLANPDRVAAARQSTARGASSRIQVGSWLQAEVWSGCADDGNTAGSGQSDLTYCSSGWEQGIRTPMRGGGMRQACDMALGKPRRPRFLARHSDYISDAHPSKPVSSGAHGRAAGPGMGRFEGEPPGLWPWHGFRAAAGN
jgi:hypothetical protein